MRRCSRDRPTHSRRDILKTAAAGGAGFVLFSSKTGTVSAAGNDSNDLDGEIHHDVVVDWDSENKDRISFEATFEFSGIDEISLWAPEEVTVEDTGGFDKSRGGYWTDTSGATIVASVPTQPDQIIQTIYGGDDWAFIAPERVMSITSHQLGNVDYTLDIAIADSTEGVSHGHHALLGSYEAHSKESSREKITVVVPDAADLVSPNKEIVDALVRTSDRLAISGESEEVYKFAVPQEMPFGGSSDGSNTSAWTRSDFPIDRAQSVWDHEYVHTRQEYQGIQKRILTDETRWIFEGQADHYGILLPFEDGRVSFSEMRSVYRRGKGERHEDVVLKERESWIEERRANYELGALVLGRLDLEIRRATDGDQSIDAVLGQLNELPADTELTHDQFLSLIEETSTAKVADMADEFISTTQRPEVWDEEIHQQYFESRTQEESTDDESKPESDESQASESDDTTDEEADDSETTPDTESTADTEDDIPGFGVTSPILALSTLAYLLKQRVFGDTQESE